MPMVTLQMQGTQGSGHSLTAAQWNLGAQEELKPVWGWQELQRCDQFTPHQSHTGHCFGHSKMKALPCKPSCQRIPKCFMNITPHN